MIIPICAIEIPENLMRQSMSERGLENLAKSMKVIGLRHPIGVRENGERYELIHGMRRLAAAKILEWTEIEADIIEVTDDVVEMIKVMENREREDVNAIEEGVFYKKLIMSKGWTQTKLAGMLQVSTGYISQRIGTNEWPRALKDAVSVGALSFSTAREIAGIKDYEHMLYITHHAARNGATPTVAREWRRRANLDYEEKLRREEGVPTEADVRAENEPVMNCHTCGEQGKVSEVKTYTICKQCQDLIEEVKRQGTFREFHKGPGATGEGEITPESQEG
ncbi:Nucleoid occlusion protein [subsurface metagenome]